MKTTMCDICREPITDELKSVEMIVKLIKGGDALMMDLCPTCYSSPVILSEMRRTRTRRPKKTRARKAVEKALAGTSLQVSPADPQ